MLKISIITPSYNQASYIKECLLSIKCQNYPNMEHIVVDGASTDGTVGVLKHYSELPGWGHLRWISEPDSGQTDAINKGLKLATGDILAYLCADDAYAPGAFHFANEFFQQHSEADMVYGECHFIDEAGKVVRRKKAVPFQKSRLRRMNFMWQPTIFFRAEVWSRVGLFNANLHFAMDYEYWLRASAVCRIVPVDRHLAYYRWQADSKTVSKNRQQLREVYEVATKFGGGGLRSWYLLCVYWPATASLKRWIFSRLVGVRLLGWHP